MEIDFSGIACSSRKRDTSRGFQGYFVVRYCVGQCLCCSSAYWLSFAFFLRGGWLFRGLPEWFWKGEEDLLHKAGAIFISYDIPLFYWHLFGSTLFSPSF